METLRTSSAGAKCKRRRQIKWRWTLEEDDLLMKLVERHGPGKWHKIAYHIEGRSGKSCRLRWINQLNPEVAKTPFSEEDRQRLLELHERYGNRWSITISHFPGRTYKQVKNEYRLLVGTKHMMAPGASSSPDGQGQIDMMMPVFGGDYSSVYGKGASIDPRQQGTSRGDSMTSDANSAAAFSEPDFESQQGVGTKDYRFIDFMGVGSSE